MSLCFGCKIKLLLQLSQSPKQGILGLWAFPWKWDAAILYSDAPIFCVDAANWQRKGWSKRRSGLFVYCTAVRAASKVFERLSALSAIIGIGIVAQIHEDGKDGVGREA